jgi:hypothetical protein
VIGSQKKTSHEDGVLITPALDTASSIRSRTQWGLILLSSASFVDASHMGCV